MLVRKRSIIDKLSMVSAELFGALELVVRKVIRSKHPYKLRKDDSVCRFLGINVLVTTCSASRDAGLQLDDLF